jgi:transcription antitermination factor NusG
MTETSLPREEQPVDLPELQQVFCVHCTTGYEKKVADLISFLHPDITALAVIQEKHQSVKGKKEFTRRVMLPGYVFLYSSQPIPFRRILPLQHVIRFLTYGHEEDFALRGDDLAFALWVRRYDGMLACSRAVSVGSSLRIIEGPLKDHIGTVEKIDRHNRNVCLGILFSGSLRKVWMPFQWAEEAESGRFIDGNEKDPVNIKN